MSTFIPQCRLKLLHLVFRDSRVWHHILAPIVWKHYRAIHLLLLLSHPLSTISCLFRKSSHILSLPTTLTKSSLFRRSDEFDSSLSDLCLHSSLPQHHILLLCSILQWYPGIKWSLNLSDTITTFYNFFNFICQFFPIRGKRKATSDQEPTGMKQILC